jgi:hypothetical protein
LQIHQEQPVSETHQDAKLDNAAEQLEAQGCRVNRRHSAKGELREVAELRRDPAATAAAWAKEQEASET